MAEQTQPIVCCQTFLEAMQPGSDDEAYGALIWRFRPGQGEYRIGCQLPSVKYCPWCGKIVAPRHPLVVAASNVVAAMRRDDEWCDVAVSISQLGAILETMDEGK